MHVRHLLVSHALRLRMLFACAVLSTLVPSLPASGQAEKWRWGIGQPGGDLIDGSWTIRLTSFEGYRPGDSPWNPLSLGWYHDWGWQTGAVTNPATGETIEYLPLVGGWNPGSASIPTIQAYVAANPSKYPNGTTWFIGNEIIDDDRRTPAQYATDFRNYYVALKSMNPTFKVCVGSIISNWTYDKPGFSGTPIQLAQAIWDAYQSQYGTRMPADAWSLHPYVWNSPTACEEITALDGYLDAFRNWMKSVGEQNKPLIVHEYGLLGFHEEHRMIEYMLHSFEKMTSPGHANGMPDDGGRRVQRFAWFSNNSFLFRDQTLGPEPYPHCALYYADSFDLKGLGYAFRTCPKSPVTGMTILSNTIDSRILTNSDRAEYAVTLVVEHPSGVASIRSIREVLWPGGVWGPNNSRAYLAWATEDRHMTDYGGTWTIVGNATGGGRWGWLSDGWGSNTYITPTACLHSACGKRRTVTFKFKVKPAWTASVNQILSGGAITSADAQVWSESPQHYRVQANAVPTITDGTVSAGQFLPDNTTVYGVTVRAGDTNGSNDLRDVRAMLHNGGSFDSANGRGYFCWGWTDADITRYGGTWTIVGDAPGGGRWGWNAGAYGSNTYVTPASCITKTYLNERYVTFYFTVKPAWAPAYNQRLRVMARDASDSTSNWVETTAAYFVDANLHPTIASNAISSTALVADNTTQYTVTLKANDGNGVNEIADMRVLLDNGTLSSDQGRANMVWGLSDADIQYYGGEWFLLGNATGGGRWALRKNAYGSDTYVTAVSCVMSTSGTQRTVVFTFRVKPAWAPASNQKLRGFVRDAYAANSGWVLSGANYNVLAKPSLPTGATANPAGICTGQTSVLSATAGAEGDQVQWFTGGCGGTLLGTGNQTVSPTATTTYYARTRNSTDGRVSDCVTVTVTVNPLPANPAPTPSPGTICAGASSTLSASVSGSTISWYTGSCGGTLVGTGNSLAVSPTTTTLYHARAKSAAGCWSNGCGSVTVTVLPLPTAPTSATVNRNNFCAGDTGNISLTATGGSGDTLTWFTGSCGGTSIGTGSPLSLASPATTTTYYARWESASCGSSTCASVAVTVTANPGPTAACRSASVTLSSGAATLAAPGIDNASSASPACGQSITSRQIARGSVACGAAGFGSSVSFGCSDVGQQTVTLRVAQTDGQTACCTATVTVSDSDTDHDGTGDCADGCPNDPNKTLPGQCGCGTADTDTDGDGVADCRDTCPNTVSGATVDANGCPPALGPDFNRDGDVDQEDFGHFQGCMTGAALGPPAAGCNDADLDGDNDVDLSDFGIFQRCLSGAGAVANANCAG